MTPKQLKSSNELADERTDLAIQRTAMAAGRTLMGWIRTALSMISFGFTIYKFLQAAAHETPVGMIRTQGPRRLGLFLIGLGVIAVLLGAGEYHNTITRLNKLSTMHFRTVNVTFIVGIVIGLLGLFLFITIATHTEVF